MHTPSVFQYAASETWRRIPRLLRDLLLRKLWLPRFIYEALPFVYILLGLVALASALFAPDWAWLWPYLALLGLVCLHAGLALVTCRYRFRRRQARPAPRR